MNTRHIIGITFRVAIEEPDGAADPEALRAAVQALVDDHDDGRRPLSVEIALLACERIVRHSAVSEAPFVTTLDNDTTVSVEGFPTLKTGAFRVICESSRSEGALGGYELASRQTFPTFEAAEQYASDISLSRNARIVVEVERGSY